ncbi:MAG: hypothetical protein N2200_05880 [Bacteroidia bacterium]|nr:hypothetical protein [Bacteroidia bacterium]
MEYLHRRSIPSVGLGFSFGGPDGYPFANLELAFSPYYDFQRKEDSRKLSALEVWKEGISKMAE